MRRFPAFRRMALLWLAVLLAPCAVRAADPQPYEVILKPSGDAALDAAVRDSATLLSLRGKAPVGGFALVRRASADLDRFRQALNAFGYYNGTAAITVSGRPLSDPALIAQLEGAPAAPPVPVEIALDHGPRFRLGRIAIEGAVPPGIEPGLTSGQDALAADVVAARDRLLTALREAGYPFAVITLPPAVLHRDQALLDVTFQVETGRRAVLGAIAFTGLRDMNEAFMRDRLLLRRGQRFSPSAIAEARDDLSSLGVFSSVRVVPASVLDPAGELPLRIDVVERKRRAVDLGAAYSTDLGPSVTVGWQHRNLFGNAEQLILTAAAQPGGNATVKPGYQFGVRYVEPGFLRRGQTLEISLNAVRQSLLAYDQTALIERAGITRKLSARWAIQAGVLGEQAAITQAGTRRRYDLVGLPLSARYDGTTSLLDPVEGARATFSLTPIQALGAQGGGRGGTYFIMQAAGSTYFDLRKDGRTVLALRGLVGGIAGADVFAIPPDLRFYAGGSATVRGYRHQSIGPRFANDRPTGGTAVAAGSVEARQRILDKYAVVAFVDAGQASAAGSPFSRGPRVGAGVGARYYTPIGPIRLDVAIPLSRQRGDDAFEVYIGIGQAF